MVHQLTNRSSLNGIILRVIFGHSYLIQFVGLFRKFHRTIFWMFLNVKCFSSDLLQIKIDRNGNLHKFSSDTNIFKKCYFGIGRPSPRGAIYEKNAHLEKAKIFYRSDLRQTGDEGWKA